MTDSAVATRPQTDRDAALLEQAAIVGDLSELLPRDRVTYYQGVCHSLGLNPLTKPFQYIVLNGRLTLYATRTATDQLRSLRGITIERIDHEELEGLYVATVYGRDANGRQDSEVGAVAIANLKGDARANAIMKAITKAKRRLTLSLAGLGWLSDTEVAAGQAVEVDAETGEVEQPKTLQEQVAARHAEITSGSDGESLSPSSSEAPLAAVDAGVSDDPEPGEAASALTAEPPPADDAGAGDWVAGAVQEEAARKDTSALAGEPPPPAEMPPPPDTARQSCDGFHEEYGRCKRMPDHRGNHQAQDGQSWR